MVLGMQPSETMYGPCAVGPGASADISRWYKILPKGGSKFEAVMNHLRESGVAKTQTDYVDLREIIIRSRLEDFRADSMIEQSLADA